MSLPLHCDRADIQVLREYGCFDLQERPRASRTDCSAHDQAIARSGKSITASDVIKAIMELDFGPADNLVPLLEHELAGEQLVKDVVHKAEG